MPLLTDNFEVKDHNEHCFDAEVRRLYIRQGPRGKQVFVPWGLTCLRCGAVVQEYFKPKPLTKAQIRGIQEYQKQIKKDMDQLDLQR